MNRRSRAIALSIFWPLIALTGACGDDSPSPGQPGDGGSSTPLPAPQASRLAWFQAAPSPTTVQGYRFSLFVDGVRTTLSGATCPGAPAPTGFECSGPIPALSSGRHVLEIAAADPLTGLESPRSTPLTVDVGGDGRPRAMLSEEAGSGPVYVAGSVLPPSTACAAGTPTTCFTVSVVAADITPVRRLLPLPDGRLLVLLQNGALTMLPSGTSERPELAARGDASTVEVVDVAADPDFLVNRFLYFATTSRAPEGDRAVSVVRVRELADRVGEPATIVTDLPAAPAGDPAMSIGPDRRIYLAMPGPSDDRAGYGAHILRFTRDGRADGNARIGSPILAQGRVRPTRLVWDATSRLLVASAESGPVPVLGVVPVDSGAVGWPAAPVSVAGTGATLPNARLSDVAAAPATPAPAAALATIEGEPAGLFIETLTLANPPQIGSKSAIPLPPLTPTAVAFASNGDLIVAVGRGTDPSKAVLLRLRRIQP